MAKPTHFSRIPRGTDISVAQLGASLIGLPLFPQGERVAELLEAERKGGRAYPEVVIQMPRRATKTTSIWATIIGRAATREGYKCVTTAQSGNIASRVLLEHATLMVASGNAVYSRDQSAHPELPVVYRNGGREQIRWPNGAVISVVPPEPGAVRSAAADDIVIDEAGEFDGAKGQDFIDAVRPLQDTRGPLAQIIMAGTPGKTRSGPFWTMLESARRGDDKDLGILDYSLRDDEDPEDRKLWRRIHPGPSSKLPSGRILTPMSVLEKRRKSMDLISFSREYLCLWPTDASTTALDTAAWKLAAEDDLPQDDPSRCVIAFDAPKEQTACAVMKVWRDDDGKACFEVLAYRPGTSWAPGFIHAAARKFRAPVVFDEIGGNVTIAADLRRRRPAVQTIPLGLRQVGGASQLLATEVRERRVRHFDQPDLNVAVESASWRPAGRDGRAFGRRPGRGEISAVVAASFGLWHYDAVPERVPLAIRTNREG